MNLPKHQELRPVLLLAGGTFFEDISTLLDLIENDKPGVLEKVSNVTNKI